MLQIEELATCIRVYKKVLDATRFIDLLEDSIANDFGSDLSWTPSLVGDGKTGQYRTSLSCMMTTLLPPYKDETELSSEFRTNVYRPAMNVVNDYCVEFMLPNGASELISILKYSGHAEYHAHHDHHPDNRRTFSLVAFLNDPEEGGHLEFPYFGVTVNPSAGDVVLFPANFPYTHIAHPVTRGVKYSMVTWFQ